MGEAATVIEHSTETPPLREAPPEPAPDGEGAAPPATPDPSGADSGDAPKKIEPEKPKEEPAAPANETRDQRIDRLARLADARTQALRAKKSAASREQTLEAEREQTQRVYRQLQEDEQLLKADPMKWAARRGVSAKEFADQFIEKEKPTPEQEIKSELAALKEGVAKMERERDEAVRAAEARDIQNQLVDMSGKFTDWVAAKADEYPHVSLWPDADVRSVWQTIRTKELNENRSRQRQGLAPYDPLSEVDIAKYLDSYLKPHVEQMQERLSKRSSPSTASAPETSTKATKQSATGKADKAGTRTLSSQLATNGSLPANYDDLSDEARNEYWAERYRKIAT